MKKYILTLSVIALVTAFISCNGDKANTQTNSTPDPLVANIDSTVKPGDDFFLFANGRWFKNHPIPASELQNGLWELIQDTINAQILNLCKTSAAIANAEVGSNKQKIGDFYFTGMDSASLNKNGISGLKPMLDEIDNIKDANGIIKMAANMHCTAGSPLFGFYVRQDDRMSSKNMIDIEQGGLSLPNRNYYFDMDARAVMVRSKFLIHLKNMFVIMGEKDDKAQADAESLMKLETAMAKSSRKKEDTRDPIKNYNKMAFSKLTETTPNLNWAVFMGGVGLHNVDTVMVGQPEFLTALNGYMKSFSLNDWKNYLKFHLIHSLSQFMDDKTYMETFSFYGTVLKGVKEPKPRWKRTVEYTDDFLGELIGQVYATDYLPKGTKEKLLEIGTAVKNVYANRIKNLDWMSAATKEKALKKLNVMVMKLGYPDKWKDLSSIKIDRTSFLNNVISANKWAFNFMVTKYGKPVDRSEWEMEPQTYNAYYEPTNNEIVIPGCNIIIPGYEHKLADDALLYSIIGGTFGHEMTHGFDDQGSQYDENGNLHNWWTTEDSTKFHAKTKKLIEQFNGYVVVDSLHINGKMTLGENIADLGGIMFAYEAFKKTKQYINKEMIGGLTPDQRFFLGYAYGWMIDMRPEALADQVRSNEHSPAGFRVIGPLSDMPDFYKAFDIKAGTKYWRADSARVSIW